jgi:mono/diheme cytochrome c family protein
MDSEQKGRVWTGAGIGAAATVAVFALGGLGFAYSGAYDIAATTPHTGLVKWVLGATMERSVRSRAASVGEPMPVDSALLVHGFGHYHAMCVDCHGAPGVEKGEYGRGLNPEPPDLAEEAHEWTDAELFWITKHGIKMTGMPAFGPTHSDEELWAIVAAVRRLEEMTPEEYAAMVAAAGGGHDHGDGGHAHEPREASGHTHAPGTPPHEH